MMEARGQWGAAVTLARLVERLGPTLLSPHSGRPNPNRTVTSVVLYDPVDPPEISPGTFVLGAGLSAADDIASAVRSFARDGAVALALREPVPHTPMIDAALTDTSLTIYELARGASWIEVATSMTSALSPLASNGLALRGHDSGTDLFELANSLAALLAAPISIVDLSSRVIAFSADQALADEGRHRTILSMHVPNDVGDLQRRHGVLHRIYESLRPVPVVDVVEGAMPRVAMRIQAGDECLGSIWAIVKQPMTSQHEQGLVDAAQVVALTMLRARLGADAAARLRLELVMSLLDGGPTALKAARQLDLDGQSLRVVAIGAATSHEQGPAVAEMDQQRVANALTMYLRSMSPRSIAALVGSTLYALVPEQSDHDARRIARAFLARLDSSRTYFAGIGNSVDDPGDLAFSRLGADAALRVVRHRATPDRRVAVIADVQVEHIMLLVAESMSADRIAVSGPLRALLDYDAEHGGSMVPTLRAWLDTFGDVAKASEMVRVHKNTFRYRLTRLEQIAGIDLSDPEVRFGLSVQLRVFP